MDAALGTPETVADRSDDLTPMMRQYFECCEAYDDSLVLFHVGDFYKTFGEAAERVARLCELTLTEREDNTGTYAMAGIPVDSAESYVERLLDAGYRVAVAEQVEDPEAVAGVAERAVTRVVTPGTLTEDELLDGDENNFVACLAAGGDAGDDGPGSGAAVPADSGETYGLALLDVSTGDCYATGLDDARAVRDEVGRFAPAEAIVGPAVPADLAGEAFDAGCMVTPYERRAFDRDVAADRVAAYFGPPETVLAGDAEVRACGALLSYAEYARGGDGVGGPGTGEDDVGSDRAGDAGTLDYVNHLARYDPREYLLLDAVALRSLEVFERRGVHGADGATLVETLDETACALGSRRLRDWLRRPLVDREAIEARLDAVEELVGRVRAREAIHERLRDVYDVERLVSRVSRGRADARDLRSLAATLGVVPEIRAALDGVESDRLREVRAGLDDLADVRARIDDAIRDDPPTEITEGGVVRDCYSEELDDLRATKREGEAWIADLEERERERTGVDSLKVGYNAVHGYYVEVTDPNLDAVPAEYTRRQTLKNAERFYTPELKRREDEIVRAGQRADDLEYELFREVRAAVAAETERLQALADALADLDVLVALADVAAGHDYARPTMAGSGAGIHVEAGRHPVVERTEDAFVPNDAHLDRDGPDGRSDPGDPDGRGFFAVVTGPNMSGKSTYMRQVALTVVMAQIGSFVPAADATVEPVDRVFTRVGASDDIAGGKSTFMVEMTELAEILDEATDRSLVLLDEVGRGTSTTDGLAIARAVTEHLHDEVGAWTLFATHHHELTGTADALPGAFNLHFSADQRDGEVAFDHEVAPGPATASYGVEVAGEAGVPEAVVARSRELLDGERAEPTAGVADPGRNGTGPDGDGSEFDGGPGDADELPEPHAEIADALRRTNLADTTPLEALELLSELQETLEEENE